MDRDVSSNPILGESMIESRLFSDEVDILLLAEGTYPFVKGGVSSWIYQMISNLPEYKFAIIFLGAYKGLYSDYQFPIPENVVSLQILYLFEREEESEKDNKVNPKILDKIKELHQTLKESHGYQDGLLKPIDDIGNLLDPEDGFNYCQFLRSEQSWEYTAQQYSKYSTDPSFLDYFWNIRNMHVPLWQLEEIINLAPKANILHTISTGYAGFLGTMLHQRFGIPLILSEHGIYSKERNIELLQSSLFPVVDRFIASPKTFNYQHRLWLNFFDSLARTCYHYADSIISLYKGAHLQQQAAGAKADKTFIIPNGVDINKYRAIRRSPHAEIPKIICFIGRVVRLKDLKTFIRAVAIIVSKDKSIRAWIRMIGNDDPDYFQECKDTIQLMGMEQSIAFITEGDMVDILPKIGILMLSSISEGMPLVILEAIASGIPVVATDVGACREIIEGSHEEDKKMGRCGAVVPIGNASGLAKEALKLLNHSTLWHEASEVGIKRAEKYYSQTDMINSYKELYNKVEAHGRDRNRAPEANQ
jgi:glycosyltransferase involved in cell wall biosynthesis